MQMAKIYNSKICIAYLFVYCAYGAFARTLPKCNKPLSLPKEGFGEECKYIFSLLMI